jgi:phage tail sheath protein FI
MANLHGVETIELTSGTVAVTTIQTAIIGLVGTAPDASAGSPAVGTVGTPILDNVVEFSATLVGRAGNVLVVNATAGVPDAENPAEVETAAVWDAAATTLSITLGCDESGKLKATPADVVTAIDAVADTKVTALGTGSGDFHCREPG